MKINLCLKLSLSLLLFCHSAGAPAIVYAQQKEQKDGSRVAASKDACTDAERAKFSVKCKDRYFLGEPPTLAISITNTSRSPQTVKEAEHQKFSFEMKGLLGTLQNNKKRPSFMMVVGKYRRSQRDFPYLENHIFGSRHENGNPSSSNSRRANQQRWNWIYPKHLDRILV